ncbi:MAG: AAA family ATPase [Chloroflexi bacterium]|nr:AAA family ATPase [Chloroflexota bacterium]
MHLVLHTLGQLQILWNNQPVTGLKLRKDQALLIYLAMNAGPIDRSRLAGLLWGGTTTPRARRNLRHALWNLRRSLTPDLLSDDRLAVGLNPAIPVWLDAGAFSTAITLGRQSQQAGDMATAISHFSTAIDLYRGDFLEQFEVAESMEFEEWAARQRARLREQALTTLSHLINYWSQRGIYPKALEYARRQVTLEPLWEEAHVRLMALLARTGQRDAALSQYETCRHLLAQEMGLAPLEETTALRERIARGEGFGEQKTVISQPTPIPFSGRQEEHATLVAWWEQARQGKGKLALIAGEAGVGKTRLMEEVSRHATLEGAVLLPGRCYEFGGSVPYQAIAEALRSYLRRMAPAEKKDHTLQPSASLPEAFSPVWLAELSRLLPEVRQLWPELPDPLPVSGGETARQRLFDAIAHFLQALTTKKAYAYVDRPLILFLDDLHWADASTLDLLHYLLRQLHGTPIWIVGTYRPEEVGPDHLLTRLRQGLNRDHLVNHLSLPPLSAVAVTDIAQSLVKGEAGVSLGDFLYHESEGNPFILVEMVYSLQEQGALVGDEYGHVCWHGPPATTILPGSVQDVILQRVGRLSPPARRLLTLAAVIGHHFDDALLRSAARDDVAMVSGSLEEWLARHLVRPEPASPGRYDFSHDKIRATVYETTDSGQRQLLHRQVGEALEQASGLANKERISLLAYHWRKAGDSDKAVPYLLQAGDQARLLHAHEEAIAFYRQALAYLQKSGESEQAARTLMKLGLIYHNTFNFSQARQAYDEAFGLWQRARAQPANRPLPPSPRPLRIRWLEPITLDPALAPDAHTDCLIAHLFSGLVELSPEMGIVPDVARRWEVSEGGQRFLFHLRNDVRWRDGVPVSAHDFEYAWKRTLDPTTGSSAASFLYDLKGARQFHQGEGRQEDVGVRALDDLTLLVELEHPVGYFPQLLTHVAWYPVPRHIVEKQGSAWAKGDHLVGNGAFYLKSWRRGEAMELVRNPTYHGRFSGNLQRLILLPVQDWATRLRWYKADELDILGITYLSAEIREEVRQRYVGEYIARPRMETHFLAFDVTRPPFDDPRVRQAFALATDRKTLADSVLQGYVAPATGGLIPPGMPGHVPHIALPFRPAEAQRLLAQAGYADGHGLPVIEVFAYEAVASRNEFLQRQWQQLLGIKVQLTVVDWVTFLKQFQYQSYHLINMGWVADYPDPDNFVRVSRARAWPHWQNETYDRLVHEARRMVDPTQRAQIYRQVEDILVQEVPILPLIYERDHLLIKPWIRTYPMSAIKPAFWKDVVLA